MGVLGEGEVAIEGKGVWGREGRGGRVRLCRSPGDTC